MLLPYQPSILDRIFRYCPVHLIHYRPPVLVDSMVDGNVRRLFAGYPINLRAGETRLAAIQPSEYHHHPVTCRLTVVALWRHPGSPVACSRLSVCEMRHPSVWHAFASDHETRVGTVTITKGRSPAYAMDRYHVDRPKQ
jgi:hypothetical protein